MDEILNAVPQILKLKDIKNATKLSRSTIYSEIKASRFPKQIHLTASKHCVGWLKSEIDSYIQDRIDQSRNVNGGA